MKSIYGCFIFILLSVHMNLLSQSSKNKENYDYQVREEEGGLRKIQDFKFSDKNLY